MVPQQLPELHWSVSGTAGKGDYVLVLQLHSWTEELLDMNTRREAREYSKARYPEAGAGKGMNKGRYLHRFIISWQ